MNIESKIAKYLDEEKESIQNAQNRLEDLVDMFQDAQGDRKTKIGKQIDTLKKRIINMRIKERESKKKVNEGMFSVIGKAATIAGKAIVNDALENKTDELWVEIVKKARAAGKEDEIIELLRDGGWRGDSLDKVQNKKRCIDILLGV